MALDFSALLESAELLPPILQAFGQSAQEASKNAQTFGQTVSEGLSGLAHAAGLGREAQHAIHAFQEFGPVVGTIIVALKAMQAVFELQTSTTNNLSTDMNHFSKTLEETRLFLDDMKKSELKQQLDRIAEDVAKARQKLLEGVQGGTVAQLADWASKATGGQGFDNADYYKSIIKDLSNRGNEIRKKMTDTGDTGFEPKKVGEVGGSLRAVGARELGKYQIDHQASMVQLLSQIAENTAPKPGGSALGNPNSSISGIPSSQLVTMSSGGSFGGGVASRVPAPAGSSSGGDFGGPAKGYDSDAPQKPPSPPPGF